MELLRLNKSRLFQKKFGLEKLQAGFIKVNQASKKVLINNNFKFEGLFKSQEFWKIKDMIVVIWKNYLSMVNIKIITL